MPRRVNRGRFVRKGVEAGSEGATPTRALLPLSAWRQGAVYAQVASTNVSPIVEASHFSLSGWRVPTLKNARGLGRFRSSTLFARRCTRPGVATERRRSFILARSASCAELAYCSASAGSLPTSTPDGTANAHVGGGGGARRCAPSCGTRAMPKFLFEAACTLDRFEGVHVREGPAGVTPWPRSRRALGKARELHFAFSDRDAYVMSTFLTTRAPRPSPSPSTRLEEPGGENRGTADAG
jgi:hypothetical protein